MSCGISVPFETLSPTRRQVTHVLLTRLPLSCPLRDNRVRLACVRHAASVDSEPGSNSHVKGVVPTRSADASRGSGKQLLTRGRLALRCSIRFQSRSHHQPLSHGLTTPVGRLLWRYALTLIVSAFALTRSGGDRVVCVCLHALSSFQRTDRPVVPGTPGGCTPGTHPVPTSTAYRPRRPTVFRGTF